MHFIASLCSVDPLPTLQHWENMVYQATTSLNLAWYLRMNLIILDYANIFGEYDYNVAPMSPSGTKVVIHDKP